MKTEIHPDYMETKVHCSCGESFTTHSTKAEIKVEICSKCHPFYTGKQKFIDTGGRVERFQKKFDATRKQIADKEEAAKKEKQEEAAKKDVAKAEFSKEEIKTETTDAIKEEAATPAALEPAVENAERVSPNLALLDEDAKIQSPEDISENAAANQVEAEKAEESTEETTEEDKPKSE